MSQMTGMKKERPHEQMKRQMLDSASVWAMEPSYMAESLVSVVIQSLLNRVLSTVEERAFNEKKKVL